MTYSDKENSKDKKWADKTPAQRREWEMKEKAKGKSKGKKKGNPFSNAMKGK